MNSNFGSQLGSQGPGYVYDPSDIDGSPSFPDVPQLLDNVNDILEYMCTPDMQKLRKDDKEGFQIHMEQAYPDFSFRYYNLFVMLLSGQDISPLLTMLGAIERVKTGDITMEAAEQYVGTALANKYVFPKLNKDKK